MINKNTLLFISDLHLDEKIPDITAIFFNFLESIAPQAKALYILGDFFEAYIGDDNNNVFITSVKAALLKASQTGLLIYLMHGNRDFLIGKSFCNDAGVTLLPDPTVIQTGKLLLMHGDSLCTQDKHYLRFRQLVRHPITKKLFLWLPLSFRKKIATNLRKESEKKTKQKSAMMMDVNPTAVNDALEKTNTMILIHGHTHKPAIHHLENNKKRVVLSAWHNKGYYLIANSSDEGYCFEEKALNTK